jgi:hypothetical protein
MFCRKVFRTETNDALPTKHTTACGTFEQLKVGNRYNPSYQVTSKFLQRFHARILSCIMPASLDFLYGTEPFLRYIYLQRNRRFIYGDKLDETPGSRRTLVGSRGAHPHCTQHISRPSSYVHFPVIHVTSSSSLEEPPRLPLVLLIGQGYIAHSARSVLLDCAILSLVIHHQVLLEEVADGAH